MRKKTGYYRRLKPEEAIANGFEVKPQETNGNNPRYYFSEQRVRVKTKSSTKSNNYKEVPKFVLSAWSKQGHMMDIDEYCATYKLPKPDITSYKLVSHTGTPFYNIVFKENNTGESKNARKFYDNLDMIWRATDLGRVKTVATLNAISTHQQQGEEGRKLADIKASTCRISCGVEDPEDIISDLRRALDSI